MANLCDSCAVRHSSVCGALSRDEITQLNAIAQQKRFARGQMILRAGDPADRFGNIVSGVVKLCRTDTEGRPATVGLQFASDFLGRPFRSENAFDAVALTDVHMCVFSSKQFNALVQASPGFEHKLLERTLDELDAAREWMIVLGCRSARDRVAALLTLIAQRSSTSDCTNHTPQHAATFEMPLSRQDIAEFLGLTIETVSRQFSLLKQDGAIALPASRDVVILDQKRLFEHAGLVPDA